MIIGLPKEIKDNESRVGLTPAGVKTLSDFGHTVLVEKSAGVGSGISDDEFRAAGGQIVETADEVWQRGEMVVKVKEPVGPEYQRMREGQLLFTYLHLAPDPKLTQAMLASKITGNDASMGWIANIIVGIIGAVIGGFVMSLIGRTGVDGFNLPSFLVATGGAVLLLAVVKGFRKR